MVKLITEMKRHTDLPIIAQPNAGTPRIDGDSTVYEMTPSDFASYAVPMVKAGASIVGGCCGTTPVFISKMAEALERL